MPSSQTPPQPPSPLAYLATAISQKRSPPKDVHPSLAGRTVLITGANSGVGLAAASKFLRAAPARLILAVRSLAKGESARDTILAENGDQDAAKGDSGTKVEVWELDMLSYASILSFVARVEKEVPEGVDVAVVNAGIMAFEYEQTAYGWEKTLQVNLLGTVLLGLGLMRGLSKRREGREEERGTLEFVGSTNHYIAKVSDEGRRAGDVLGWYSEEKNFAFLEQYNLSKLFLMYAQTELVELGKPKDASEGGVNVVVICPGATVSDLGRDGTAWYQRILKYIVKALLLKTTEQGARTYVSGAVLGDKGNGKFWTHDEIKEPASLLVGSENESLQAKVWGNIIDALKKDVPEVDRFLATKA